MSSSGDEIVNGLQQLGEDHGISGVDVETRDLPPLPRKRKEDGGSLLCLFRMNSPTLSEA